MDSEQLASFISQGFDAAKAGNAIAIYSEALPYFENGAMSTKSHYAFGWIIYYALHQHTDNEIAERKHLLANYLKLHVVKPHKLHSMILLEAIRLYRNVKNVIFNTRNRANGDKNDAIRFSLVKFAELWNLRNLRPGDWNRKSYEGKDLSSTVEKFITCYVDEIEEVRQMPSGAFLTVINKAMTEYPNTVNLLAQRSAVYQFEGENEKAAALLRKALLFAPFKSFLWSRLASFYSPTDDTHRHVALLYKALSAPGPEQFKGRIRLSLAQAFILRKMYGFALWELDKVKSNYEAEGWHTPRAYKEAMEKIPAGTPAENPEELYRRLAPIAESEIYDMLPVVKVSKTYHKDPEANPTAAQQSRYGKQHIAWRVTDKAGNNYWLQPHRFGIRADLPIGTQLHIRLHESRPVKAELI